jgi:hypothetical protein
MCIIAAQFAGSAALPVAVLKTMWDGNQHGAGYMFVADGQVIIRKPFFKRAELIAAYQNDHRDFGAASAFVLHFRWATHGPRTTGNTHPHVVKADRERVTVGLVHNGILDIGVKRDSPDSDTVVFCRDVLGEYSAREIMGGKMRRRLGRAIGSGNKFVLLDSAGKVSIVNEKEGIWDGGTWYSNDGFIPEITVTPAAGTWSKSGELWSWNNQSTLWSSADVGEEFDYGWQDKHPDDMTEAEWRAAQRLGLWDKELEELESAEDLEELAAFEAEWEREKAAYEARRAELREMDNDWSQRIA